MKRKLTKLMAVALATTTILGTPTVAQAAALSAEQIDAADIYTDTVLDESNQVVLTGNWYFNSNPYGSPDPVIVNNGDNTYDIVMYVGQELLVEITDTARKIVINDDGTTEISKYNLADANISIDFDYAVDSPLNLRDTKPDYTVNHVLDREDLVGLMGIYESAECPLSYIFMEGKKVGTYTAPLRYQEDVYTENGDWLFIRNCGIILNITILPKQYATQTPTYSKSDKLAIETCGENCFAEGYVPKMRFGVY
jgi:hypothetical protein